MQDNAPRQFNPVVWFEIYVQDMERARAFYEAVLAIKLETLGDPTNMGMNMLVFPGMGAERPGAGGALVQMQGVASGPGGTLVYFGCDDCAVEESRVQAAGGAVVKPKTSIGEYGFMVLAQDTEGNLIGLHSMK